MSTSSTKDVRKFNQRMEETGLLNVVIVMQKSYHKYFEVYKIVAARLEMLCAHYTKDFDEIPKIDRILVKSILKCLIVMTKDLIQVQENFGRINRELQFIHVIIDCCLISAIDLFFESTERAMDILLTQNKLMSICIDKLGNIHLHFLRNDVN